MSDSDETVCGEENENTENSPSILSNWHEDKAVLSPQKVQDSPKNIAKTCPLGREETRDIVNDKEAVSRSEGSPEFSLVTRGVKRKESFDEVDNPNPDVEVVKETNTKHLHQTESCLSQSENVCTTNVTDSQTTDIDQRIENLLKTVEKRVKDMEMASDCEGKNSTLGALPDAKTKLAEMQKLLVESNRLNQAKRITVLSDGENSQQLSDDKKLLIVNLAKKQRNLLEIFKKYKNLIQRLKAMKDVNNISQRSGQLPEKSCVHVSSESSQSLSKTNGTASISTPPSGQPPNRSIQVSIQSYENVPKSTPRLVVTNMTNLTNAIKQGSVKFMLLQNRPNNSSGSPSALQVSSQTLEKQSTSESIGGATSLSNASRPRQPTVRQHVDSAGQTLCVQNTSSLKATPSARVTNTTPSTQSNATQPGTCNASMRKAPQSQAGLPTTKAQNTTAVITCPNPSWVNQNSSQSSMKNTLRPMVQNLAPTNRSSSNQPTAAKPQSQTIQDPTTGFNRAGMNRSSVTNPCASTQSQIHPLTNILATNEVTSFTAQSQSVPGSTTTVNRSGTNQNTSHFSTTIPRSVSQRQNVLPRSRQFSKDQEILYYIDSQSNTRPLEQAAMVKQTPTLSLDTLVKKGVLAPGKNVLIASTEGKLYSASLSDKGTIISAGGEGFTSPRSWVKAILGSKRKVKNELAWKMISYKNKSLLDHANTVTPEPTSTRESSINFNIENQDSTQKITTRRGLINNADALKTLLNNCRIIGTSSEEIISSEELQEDFWDKTDADWETDDILKALDF